MVYNRTDGVGWDNLVIIGIILGSFTTAFINKEFSIVKTNKKIVIRTIIGSMLMGVGAVWAKGCLIGNGLVATSQLATRAWLAILFITLGIWFGAWLLYVRGSQTTRS